MKTNIITTSTELAYYILSTGQVYRCFPLKSDLPKKVYTEQRVSYHDPELQNSKTKTPSSRDSNTNMKN